MTLTFSGVLRRFNKSWAQILGQNSFCSCGIGIPVDGISSIGSVSRGGWPCLRNRILGGVSWWYRLASRTHRSMSISV